MKCEELTKNVFSRQGSIKTASQTDYQVALECLRQYHQHSLP